MSNKDIAMKVENLSKRYRIGLKEEMHDSFGSAIFDFIIRPLKNYRKYRSLYRFDDANPNSDSNNSDVIWALRGVSFEVKQGEVLGIIGRNGAGKTTLLKILSKITEPTGGYAEVKGKISSLLEVGTGFHQELTGRENVYLNGTVLGMTKKEVDRKFDEIVSFSGVKRFIDTPVKRYSTGMKVRLAFSVAAHLEPEILLIDEVLAVGDADFQKKCLDKMENVGQQGKTVLFVSHNMPAVNRLCQRAILMDNGQIVDDGPAHQVTRSYLTSDTGTMAAREWLDINKSPGGSIARLRAARVKTEDGHVTDSIDIRNPVRLEMEYDVLESNHLLLPHFHLRNELGELAFITVDLDPDWRLRPRPEGHYVSTAWIPGNLLAEGMLYVTCSIVRMNPDIDEFTEHSVVAFNVVDTFDGDSARGDWARNIPGVVRPLLKWSTEFNPNGIQKLTQKG